MKKVLLSITVVLMTLLSVGQTTVFHEDFELPSLADSVVSTGTPGAGMWSISTTLFASPGLRSYHDTVSFGDTVYLATNAFSTIGNSAVILYFDQICKIEYFDAAEIEVSNNNGATWVKLTGSEYLGAGQFATTGNKFTSASYVDWLIANPAAVPTNTWWRSEAFDIGSLVANSAQVKIRFVLRDANNTGGVGNYGWLLDNIRVTMSFSEMIPPTISMVTPIVQDTVYSTGPYVIKAKVTDQSGLDTVYLRYVVSTGLVDTIGMTMIAPDTFAASIPFYGFGKNISYKVIAIDASLAANQSQSSSYNFFCKFSTGGTYQLGTATTTSSGFPCVYGQYWTGDKEQHLILASELQALNMPAGPISALSFYVVTPNGPTTTGVLGNNHNNLTIKMKNTSITAMNSTSLESGLTQVFTTPTYQTVTGWNTHTFQTPFVWDGVSNLLVETCFDNYTTGYSYSSYANVHYTLTPFTSVAYYYSDGGSVCPTMTPSSTSSNRVNMKLEVQGVMALTLDAGAGQFVNPTGGVVANTSIPVNVRIKNFGTDTLLSASVGWSLDGVVQTSYPWTGSVLKDSLSALITLGNINVSPGAHQLKFWTDNPNGSPDLNTGNDTLALSFFACANLLSGTYTIGGTGANFATFADAMMGLVQCGINGPVVFNVAQGTYNEQILIPAINGASATNTITFQSASSDSTHVILTKQALNAASNYLIRFEGAQYVTFKNIKFVPIDSNFANAIVFAAGAKYNKLIGNYFIGKTGTNVNLAVIRNENVASSDNLIQGNRIEGGSYGVYFKGSSNTALIANNDVKGNTMVDFGLTGVYGEFVGPVIIEGNHISKSTFNSGTSQGIHLLSSRNGINVLANQIVLSNAYNTNGIHLQTCLGYDSARALVANNFVSILNGSNFTYGIRINGTTFHDIYYNSINVNGTSNTDTRGINPVSSGNIRVLNNNIQSNKYPTFYEGTSVSRSDYNNLYSTGSVYAFYTTSTQTFTNFNAFRAALQKDSNSVSTNPFFTSATDLHTSNGLINGIATPLSSVQTDIDGQPRNATTPDIGADEFNPSSLDASMLALFSPGEECGLDSFQVITVTIKNVGADTISSGLTASMQINGGTVITEPVNAVILPNTIYNYSFVSTVMMNMYSFNKDSMFYFKFWTSLVGDNFQANDTLVDSLKSKFTPLPPVVTSPVSIAYATQATLTASSPANTKVKWYDSPVSTVLLDTGLTYITPQLFYTDTFYASAVASGFAGQVVLGTGTNVNTTSGYPAVYGQYFTGDKEQYIILASELLAAQVTPGAITSLAFDVVTPNGPTTTGSGTLGLNHVNFTIRMKNSTLSAFPTTGAQFESGLTQVFTIPTYQTVSGWNNHVFQTPFIWDGVSNIVVETCFENYTGGSSYSTNTVVNRTLMSYQSSIYYYSDGGGVCGYATGTSSNIRPNMKFTAAGEGCPSDRSEVVVMVGSPPANDAGITQVVFPSGAVPSGIKHPINVTLKNFGTSNLQSAGIVWQLNAAVQDTFNWTGNLMKDSTLMVTIDSMVFAGGPYVLRAWSILPNSVADIINGNDTAMTNFTACLNGTYTIGPDPTDHFPSFNAAKNALVAAGVCGDVVFLVDTGTYNEQLLIPAIGGASANSTITFKGATGVNTDVRLQFAPATTTDMYIVKLNGANWVRFQDMTIKSTSTLQGRGVELQAGASNNKFRNLVIDLPNSTSSNFCGFYSYSSSNDTNNHFVGNWIKNSYYGFYLYGTSTAIAESGIVIDSNYIDGYYYYGAYLYNTSGIKIRGNKFRTSTATGFVTNYGYGIYGYYDYGSPIITGNSFDAPSLYYHYPMYVNYYQGTISNRALIANNMLSVPVGAATSQQYGMYLYYLTYTDIFYNSVNVPVGSNTSRALYLYYGNDNELRNNNFVQRSGGYAAYVVPGTNATVSDNNNYYTSGGTNFVYWNGNYANLAALQAVSGKDMASVSVLPDFVSPTDLHLTSTGLSGFAVPLSRVTVDIDGDLRTAAPTIGADEKPLIPIDAGVNFVYSPPSIMNEGATVPVIVRIRNFGLDTLFSVPLNYYVPGTSISVNFTYVDTLASGDTALVVMPSMIAPAGNRQLCAKSVVAGDTNFFNDQTCKAFYGTPIQDAYVTEVLKIEEGCGLGLDTISIRVKNIGWDTIPAGFTAKYQEEHLTPVSATVNQSILPGDSIIFHFPTLFDFSVTTVDSTFRIKAWTEVPADNVEMNDTASVKVLSVHTPPAPITSNVTVPYASPANLTATSTTNDKLYWYASDTAQAHLDTGNLYVTPLMYATDTFYVAAKSSTAFTGGLGVGVNIAPLSTITGVGLSTGTLDWARSFDGDTGTITSGQQCWISTATPPNGTEYWDWNWTQPYTISSVKFYLAQNTARTLTGATFQVWNGTNWVNHHTWVQPQGPFSFTINFAPVTTTKLRCTGFQMTGIGQLSNPNFREIEVFLSSIEGCSSARVPVIVTVGAPAQYDAGAFKFVEPVSAVNMGANETVKIKIRNYGTQSISNFQASFKVDNLAAVTETVAGPLASGDSMEYTFLAKANLSSVGTTYQLKAWTTVTGDNTPINDTVYKSVTNMLPNYCPCAATSTGYEDISRVKVANLDNFSGAPGSMYTDFTNLPPAILSMGLTDSILVSTDFPPSYTYQYACWVNVFIDWNRDGTFDPLAELVFSMPTTSQNTVADTFTVPFSASPGLTRMRVVMRESGTAANTGPCGTFTWGEAEDYLVQVAPLVATDAGVQAITSPTGTVSGGTNVPVTAVVRNFGTNPILPGQLQVKFQLDNSPVYTVTVQNTLQSLDTLTVSAGIWPVPTGQHQLCVWTVLANDSVTFNDQKCIGVFGELYTSVPYSDNFEGTVNWNATGTKGNWQHGVPAGTTINVAHSPTKVWMTMLNANYDHSANELLYTPRFNFSGLLPTDTATMKFWHWMQCETTNDAGHVQYSTNGGQTWVNLGFIGDPQGTNWYNTNAGGTHCFSGQSAVWTESSYKLDPVVFNGQPLVQFRFRFFSNASNNAFDGWAIDDFAITLPMEADDVGIDAIHSPVGGTIIGSQVTVKVRIKNFGSNTQTSIPLQYRINNDPPVVATWTGTLASLDTASYTFSVPYTSPTVNYQFCAKTNLVGDGFTPNDQLCVGQTALPAPFDAGVVSILHPGDTVCRDQWGKPVIAVVKNFGTSTLTTMNIQYQINVATPVVETWNGSLLPGDSMTYTFNTLYSPPIGVFMMCVQTNLNIDANATNDKACRTVASKVCIGVGELENGGLVLGQNHPNPTRDFTMIDVSLPSDGEFTFAIVNLLGQTVESRVIGGKQGVQTLELDLAHLESGVYYYTVRFNGYSMTRKMVIE
jgi:hypothetical protein